MSYNPYKLFSVFGIEIEYMIVNKSTLRPEPIADIVLKTLNSDILVNEVELGSIAVSNELALHVIELKTNGPADSLNELDKEFAKVVSIIQEILDKHNSQLLPTGMHPFFIPDASLKLWPHSNKEIYNQYNAIFDCKGHGWGNLQSTHINLPFSNEEEFRILHDSIRFLLPIIPALTASTPIAEGTITTICDNRLLHYGKNQALIPCIAGDVIPESVSSIDAYYANILQPMYDAIAPFDKKGILQDEWLNSRGAIARFQRGAIEIRIVDSQESPKMDIFCVMLIVLSLKYLSKCDFITKYKSMSQENLKLIYQACIEKGSQAEVNNTQYFEFLGMTPLPQGALKARDIWNFLYDTICDDIPTPYQKLMTTYLQHGTLAERIVKEINASSNITSAYHKLHQCLIDNVTFDYHD